MAMPLDVETLVSVTRPLRSSVKETVALPVSGNPVGRWAAIWLHNRAV